MGTPLAKTHAHAVILTALRRILLIIFLLGALGAGAELLLLGHTEDRWQWTPLLLFALSLVALIGHAAFRRAATVRVFQTTMILFVISGFVGLALHYQGKVEFKLETNPDLAGLELFWETIKGATVPPILAPGLMIQLGLLGLAWTYRHPALARLDRKTESTNTGE
jgi:hypothetical protein